MVSFPGRWWEHIDRSIGINSYIQVIARIPISVTIYKMLDIDEKLHITEIYVHKYLSKH